MQTIAVLMGGPSTEHEVSLASGENVCANLDRKKYQVLPVRISKKGLWTFGNAARHYPLLAGIAELQRRKIAVVFIALHGVFGEDGKLQALLETANIRYTGSGPAASALAMDKKLSGLLFQAAGLRVPAFTLVRQGEKGRLSKFPVILKPRFGGSSVGITIAKNPQAYTHGLQNAWRYEPEVVVQKYISGVELTCGVIESVSGKPQALLPTLIRPVTAHFFGYKAKYTPGMTEEITPAPLPNGVLRKIQAQALLAHTTLGCRGFSRTDFIIRGQTMYVLETNSIPGLTQESLLPKAARASGLPFAQLLDRIIRAGVRR
ncbi:MAG: D-alanine--D-alanine ligase [Patescibacteria group bacterium]